MHGSLDPLHTGWDALALLGAGAYQASRGVDFPTHQHRAWEVVYYRRGRIGCPIGDRTYEAGAGTVLLTPPRTIHAEIAHTDYANLYILIDAPSDQAWPVLCFDDADQSLLHVCAALVREWAGRSPDRAALIGALLAQLDILVRRAEVQRQRPAAERTVQAAERLIEEHLTEPLTITGVARQLGVAPPTLRAQFAAVRGYSPQAYLQRVRIDRALALIRGSSLTLDAVASMSGYCSASHLSRQVKRATGTSPGAIRTTNPATPERHTASTWHQ